MIAFFHAHPEAIFCLIALWGLLLVGVFIYVLVRGYRRTQAMRALAARWGFNYLDFSADLAVRLRRISALDPCNRGVGHTCSNILLGRSGSYRIIVCDFRYEFPRMSHDDSPDYQHLGCAVLEQDGIDFPYLEISPRNVGARLLQRFEGHAIIQTGHAAFDHAFCITANDHDFVRGVCHPTMVEYLLQHPDLHLEFNGPYVAYIALRCWKPEEIESRLRQLIEVRRLIPEAACQTYARNI